MPNRMKQCGVGKGPARSDYESFPSTSGTPDALNGKEEFHSWQPQL